MSKNAELLAEINRRVDRAKAANLAMLRLSKEVKDLHAQFPHRCEEYIKETLKEALRKNGMDWDTE